MSNQRLMKAKEKAGDGYAKTNAIGGMVPIVSGGVSNGHSRRVPYPMPYRQMRLLEKARNFETVRRMPLLVELMDEVNGLILKDENDTWPPKTAKHSVTSAIDVPATWILFRQGPATRS